MSIRRDPLLLAAWDDLHREQGEWTFPLPTAEHPEPDVVALNGDIAGDPEGYLGVVREARAAYPNARIFGVLGNHEHYGRDIEPSTAEYAALSGAVDGFDMLVGARVVEHRGWRFIGATLWSDIPPQWEDTAWVAITDFRVIQRGDRRFLPSDATAVHRATVRRVRALLADDADAARTVVLTHHAPSFRSWTWTGADARDREGAQPFYCSALDDVVERSYAWLHGHIHAPSLYRCGDAVVGNNPLGYEYREDTNPDFRPYGLRIALDPGRRATLVEEAASTPLRSV